MPQSRPQQRCGSPGHAGLCFNSLLHTQFSGLQHLQLFSKTGKKVKETTAKQAKMSYPPRRSKGTVPVTLPASTKHNQPIPETPSVSARRDPCWEYSTNPPKRKERTKTRASGPRIAQRTQGLAVGAQGYIPAYAPRDWTQPGGTPLGTMAVPHTEATTSSPTQPPADSAIKTTTTGNEEKKSPLKCPFPCRSRETAQGVRPCLRPIPALAPAL